MMKPQLKEYAYPAIIEFIQSHAHNKDSVVIGLSGGIDSAVVSKLCCDALDPKKIINFIMPSPISLKVDVEDAIEFCKRFDMKYHIIELEPILNAYSSILDLDEPTLKGNVMARSRMTLLYHHAHSQNGIVMGTGNKSELLTGYFTKYGDGGVDLLPIGDLYKTEVKALAKEIDIPESIISKSPSAGLCVGQTDEEDLGITYDMLDEILFALERSLTDEEICIETGFDSEVVQNVLNMYQRSAHKRKMPLIPKLSTRTIGCDWRE